ncbi:MAG: XisI protein [Cyanomargarita calcarea GSE-NOS-MK-12-04C]|uniref:XisI protein n=1 Tax=Cyanomargarita calcarea GSE-NOS-MK-12-04C TaxID=2839659 RepID=A0A951UUL6_9CYAN|nr:XisI protein [Cyanomargarita calcarea GSE-NOS-MK-12-04C]
MAIDLLREVIPQSDIMLASHSPEKRQFTEFATA